MLLLNRTFTIYGMSPICRQSRKGSFGHLRILCSSSRGMNTLDRCLRVARTPVEVNRIALQSSVCNGIRMAQHHVARFQPGCKEAVT